jgi:antitoxin component YwqK of YwqJK toxin-antitoxin module
MSSEVRCKAITEAGVQCSRNAVINGYCTQHYKKLEQELPPDITNNILSEYIEVEELKQLETQFEGLKINPKRIEIKEKLRKDGSVKNRYTYYDDKLIRMEGLYKSGNVQTEYNFKTIGREGKQYGWYDSGEKWFEYYYENGEEEGKQYEWYEDGKMKSEENYKNGIRDGPQFNWRADGRILNIEYYVNGRKISKK